MSEQPTPSPTRWKLSLFLILIFIIITAIGVKVILGLKPTPLRTPPPAHKVQVEVRNIQLSTHRLQVKGMGEVKAHRELSLQPRVSSVVASVPAGIQAGAMVKEGQVLCQLDDSDFRMALEREKANLSQQRLNLMEEEGRVELAKAELQSLDLAKSTDLQRQLSLRVPHLERAKTALEGAKAAVKIVELQIERCTIKAPFDGILLRWQAHPGAMVSPQTSLGHLLDHQRFDLELQLSREQLPLLPQQSNLPVTFQEPAVKLVGTLQSILPERQQRGRLVTALVSIDKPLSTYPIPLLVGSFVQASLESRPFDNSTLLPRRAINERGGVWLCSSEGTLVHRPVSYTLAGEEEVLITAGLSNGDQWVETPLTVTVEGMKLTLPSKAEGMELTPQSKAEPQP